MALCVSVLCVNCAATGGIPMAGGQSSSSTAKEPYAEREILSTKLAAVNKTPWPKPQSISISERLTGLLSESDDRVTRDDAIAAYITDVTAFPAPCDQIKKDALAQTTAALELAFVAEASLESLNPRMSDVAVVEEAIKALSESRSIYLASLKRLPKADPDDRAAARDMIRMIFDDAVVRLGTVADELADRVAADRTQSFAGPYSLSQ